LHCYVINAAYIATVSFVTLLPKNVYSMRHKSC